MKTQASTSTLVAAVVSRLGHNNRTFAGVPFRAALVYALLFVIAFGFYTTCWMKAPVIEPDTGSYLRAAHDLADFRIDQLQERPPGYPLLLLVTGSSLSPTRALFHVSLLFHFVTIWLLGSALHRVGLSEIMLIVFGLILLLPPYVEPAGYVLSENLAALMLVGAFVGVVFWILDNRTVWMFISALAIAYAALTRPAYQFLSLAIVGYLAVSVLFHWSRLKRNALLKGASILISGSIILVGGYALFNYKQFGYFLVTPKFGLTLSTKTFGFVERLPDKYAPVRSALIKARNDEAATGGSRAGTMSIWRAVPELTKITGLQGPQLSDYMLKLNLLLIRQAPLRFLEEVVWAFGCYWFPSSNALANFDSRLVQSLWAVIHFSVVGVFFVTLVLITGGGAVVYFNICDRFLRVDNRFRPGDPRVIEVQALIYGLAAAMVFYTAVVSCVIEMGAPRYRIPTDALIVFMLLLGIDLWRRLFHLFVPAMPVASLLDPVIRNHRTLQH